MEGGKMVERGRGFDSLRVLTGRICGSWWKVCERRDQREAAKATSAATHLDDNVGCLVKLAWSTDALEPNVGHPPTEEPQRTATCYAGGRPKRQLDVGNRKSVKAEREILVGDVDRLVSIAALAMTVLQVPQRRRLVVVVIVKVDARLAEHGVAAHAGEAHEASSTPPTRAILLR